MTPGPYPVVMSNGIGGWHSKYMVKGPGVVTGRSGTIGSLHYIEQNFWPHNTSLWVTSFNGNEPRFIYWLYASIGLERFGSGSGVPTLNRNDVHDLQVGFPCDVVEQRRIGTFFSCLDHLITLHQRKCRYRSLCGYLSWEQRKLGEFSKKITTKNADGGLSETFTNSAEQGVISQRDYFDHDITNNANISGYYVVQPDNFVYNPRISVTAPCGPINRNRLNRAGVMSPLYTVFSVDESVDKAYLEHYFKTSRWHDFMFLEGNSGARSDRFSISDATFFEMPIWCPKIPEQRAIAKQLETTDSLITLHQ